MSQRMQKSFGPELWAQGTRGNESPAAGRAYIENMHTYTSGLLGPRPKWKAKVRYTGSDMYEYFATVKVSQSSTYRGVAGFGSGGAKHFNLETLGTYGLTGVTLGKPYFISDNYTLCGDTTSTRLVQFGNTASSTVVDINTAYGYSSHTNAGGVMWQGRGWYWAGYNTYQDAKRLHYTDEYDFDAFTASGYFEFDDGQVGGAFVDGNDLLVWTTSGRWFRLTSGGGGVDAISITPMGDGRRPYDARRHVTVDGVTFFWSFPGPMCAVTAVSNGQIDDSSLSHLTINNEEGASGVMLPSFPAGSSVSNMVYLPYRDSTDVGHLYGVYYWNGAWWNDTTMDFSGLTAGTIVGAGANVGGSTTQDYMWLAHRWFTNSSPAYYNYIYTRDLSLDRPSKDADDYSSGTEEMYVDDTLTDVTQSGTVNMPRLQGVGTQQYVRIEKISIDAEYWKGTGYPTVALTVAVVDQEGNSQSVTTDLDAGSLANATRGAIRITGYVPAMPFTPWAEVRISGIDALALEYVHVDFSVEDRAW